MVVDAYLNHALQQWCLDVVGRVAEVLRESKDLSGVAPANQTKERSVHELFTGAFRNKCSM